MKAKKNNPVLSDPMFRGQEQKLGAKIDFSKLITVDDPMVEQILILNEKRRQDSRKPSLEKCYFTKDNNVHP